MPRPLSPDAFPMIIAAGYQVRCVPCGGARAITAPRIPAGRCAMCGQFRGDATGVRYQVRRVADAACSALRPEIEAATDDLGIAQRLSAAIGAPYGAGIEDTASGLLDFGEGFGVAIVRPVES